MKIIHSLIAQLIWILLFAVLSICFTCKIYPKKKGPVIARVGRSILTLNDLNKSIPSEYSNRITRKQRINYVKQWIDTELLYQEALRQKIHKEKEICKRLEQMKKDLLGAEMISRSSSGIHRQRISEESIINYYEQNKKSFIRESDVVKYIEIVVEDLKKGWNVRNMITSNNFLALAAKYSTIPIIDPNTAPYIPLKDLPQSISKAISNTNITRTTSPLQMPDGFHLIRILDKQKGGDTCFLEEVSEEIISTLSAQSQKKDIENLLSDLRQKIDCEFHFELITQDKENITEDVDSLTNDTGIINSGLNKKTIKQ